MEPEIIKETVGSVKWEYTLNEMAGLLRVPLSLTHTHIQGVFPSHARVNQLTGKVLGGETEHLEKKPKLFRHGKKMRNSTQTMT